MRLLNGSYKITGKVLATGLAKTLDGIIEENQCAFIHRRELKDAFLVANEAVYSLKKQKKKVSVCKLDFSKVYDRVRLSFLAVPMEYHYNTWVPRITEQDFALP